MMKLVMLGILAFCNWYTFKHWVLPIESRVLFAGVLAFIILFDIMSVAFIFGAKFRVGEGFDCSDVSFFDFDGGSGSSGCDSGFDCD